MNVIIAYLETMFSAFPATPRMIEARAELQAMMEDAYAAAIAEGLSENEAVGKVITEFGNLDELAPVLGISREIHPTGGSHAPGFADPAPAPHSSQATPGAQGGPAQQHTPAAPAYPPLRQDAAEAYAQLRSQTESRVGIAVALFVASPALLIALTSLSNEYWPGSANVATFAGILGLAACVATGVLLLVGRSQRLSPFARLELGEFSPSPEVAQWASGLAAEHSRRRTARLQLAIGLWIFALVPVFAVIMLPSAWSGVAVSCSLLIVATGLLVFLPSNWAASAASVLTQRGDGIGQGDDEHSIVGVIASFYWPLVTAAYLGWSFIGDAWGDSWIIWPIAGVLFGALAAGLGAWESYRAARR